jgi:hypothetical protein
MHFDPGSTDALIDIVMDSRAPDSRVSLVIKPCIPGANIRTGPRAIKPVLCKISQFGRRDTLLRSAFFFITNWNASHLQLLPLAGEGLSCGGSFFYYFLVAIYP